VRQGRGMLTAEPGGNRDKNFEMVKEPNKLRSDEETASLTQGQERSTSVDTSVKRVGESSLLLGRWCSQMFLL